MITLDDLNKDIGETGIDFFDNRSKYGNIVDEQEYNLEDYNITKVTGDTILTQFVDETEDGLVKKGSIFIPQNDKTKDFYRFAKVILKGPKVSEVIEVGDIVLIAQASLLGVRGIKTKSGKFQFITEDRIFGVVEKA